MFQKLKKMWRSTCGDYSLGVNRGLAIGLALAFACRDIEGRPWMALAWVACAALHLYGSVSERRVFESAEDEVVS